MKQVFCKMITNDNTKEGIMFNVHNDYSFEELIKWVYRNCKGCNKVEIDNDRNEITAIYDDERYEIYFIK